MNEDPFDRDIVRMNYAILLVKAEKVAQLYRTSVDKMQPNLFAQALNEMISACDEVRKAYQPGAVQKVSRQELGCILDCLSHKKDECQHDCNCHEKRGEE